MTDRTTDAQIAEWRSAPAPLPYLILDALEAERARADRAEAKLADARLWQKTAADERDAAEAKLDIVRTALTRFGLRWAETANTFSVSAGIAELVKLPEPNVVDVDENLEGWTTWNVRLSVGSVAVDHCSEGIEHWAEYRIRFRGRWMTIGDAEKIAGALLAAAKLGRLQEPKR